MENYNFIYLVIALIVVAILVYGKKRNKEKKSKIAPYAFTKVESEKVNEYTQYYLEKGVEIQTANLRAKQRVILESK